VFILRKAGDPVAAGKTVTGHRVLQYEVNFLTRKEFRINRKMLMLKGG
jgi:hypothetical protein